MAPRVRIKKGLFGRYTVKYDCPNCATGLKSPLEDAGKADNCPSCGSGFVVPGKEQWDQILWIEKQKAARRALKREENEKRRVMAKALSAALSKTTSAATPKTDNMREPSAGYTIDHGLTHVMTSTFEEAGLKKKRKLLPYAIVGFFGLGLLGIIVDPQTGVRSSESSAFTTIGDHSDKKNADLLIAGIAFLGGSNAIESVSVNGNEATITVANAWHYTPYQIRLQAAQNIWKVWYHIAPTRNADEARISIVDLNGNEVGGSRVLGGSLIWVQDN